MADLPVNANESRSNGFPTPLSTARKPSGKRPFFVLSVVVGALLLIFAIYEVATRNLESTNDAQVEANVAQLATHVAGTVMRIPVKDNQKVKAGDLLVELDPTDYAVRMKQAEAQVEAAKAQADMAEAQERIVEAASKGGLTAAKASLSGSTLSVRGAAAQVEAAKAALLNAQAGYERAEADFKRGSKLFEEKAFSQADFDKVKTAYESAQAMVEQAKAQLAAAQEQKNTMESKVSEAQGRLVQSEPVSAQIAAAHAATELARANLKNAQAALEQARLQLSYTRITAPFDGTLSQLAVREGQFVQPAQMVVEIVPPTSYVVANFKETQIGRMKPGQRVKIEIDAFPGRSFDGRVQSIAAGTGAWFSLLPPDNASGNFVKVVQRVPVKIVWTKLPIDLMPQAGLSATVTVYLK